MSDVKTQRNKTGRSCLYINKLADIDMDVLKQLMVASVEYMSKTTQATDDES